DTAASGATRLPVPLLPVGGRAAAPAARAPWEEPLANGDTPPPGTMTEAAARAAIEADGYKAVRALSHGPSGAWQARALRGSTEVQLSVDRTGGVSAN
ncbi:MAG: hypothetical protein K2Y40_14915, partial [Reyranella sp.]|nr:hypothetical protein [Reyranella sp.]